MTAPASQRGTHRGNRRIKGLDSRAAILAAATRLFMQLGYVNVSTVDIAREAGVSLPVVQAVTGGKAAILTLLIDEGSHDPIVEWTLEAVRACHDPYEAVARAVHGIRVDNERYADVLPVMGTEAEGAAVRAPDRPDRHHLECMSEIAARLAETDSLKPELDRERAAGILWFYLGHHSWELCVSEQGWSWAETEQWLTEQLAAALLGGRSAGSASS